MEIPHCFVLIHFNSNFNNNKENFNYGSSDFITIRAFKYKTGYSCVKVHLSFGASLKKILPMLCKYLVILPDLRNHKIH